MEVIDLDHQSHFGHFDSEFWEIQLCHTITLHRFGLESPNLHQTCIMGYSRLVSKKEFIDLDRQGHFDSEFWEILLVRAITHHRFVLESPKVHSGILSAGIEIGSH